MPQKHISKPHECSDPFWSLHARAKSATVWWWIEYKYESNFSCYKVRVLGFCARTGVLLLFSLVTKLRLCRIFHDPSRFPDSPQWSHLTMCESSDLQVSLSFPRNSLPFSPPDSLLFCSVMIRELQLGFHQYFGENKMMLVFVKFGRRWLPGTKYRGSTICAREVIMVLCTIKGLHRRMHAVINCSVVYTGNTSRDFFSDLLLCYSHKRHISYSSANGNLETT